MTLAVCRGKKRTCLSFTISLIPLCLLGSTSGTENQHKFLVVTSRRGALLQHNAPWAWLSNTSGRSLERVLVKHRRKTLMYHAALSRLRGSQQPPPCRGFGATIDTICRREPIGRPRDIAWWASGGHARSAIGDPQGSDLQLGRDGGLTAPQLQEVLPAVGTPDPGGEVTRESINLDRFLGLLDAGSTKKLGVWVLFLVIMSRLKSFYGVMLGTFVLSYIGNTVVSLAMDKGNRIWRRMTTRVGTKRLPTQLPRTVYASVYMLLLLTVLTSLSVTIVPRLTVESQVLITKLSEQDNPYAIIADWMKNNFGEEALGRLEPFLLSVCGDDARLFAGYPENHLDLIASKLRGNASRWGEERYGRFTKLLQFCLNRYFKGGLNMCRSVVTGLTKVLYKALVSLFFSFMVIWDLPNLQRGVRALKTSRLGFAYKTISPQVATFAKLVGQSFEVQFTIAVINTLLTTAGLIALGVSGPLVLSFIVFVCSFVPVIGVFLSTLPMVVAALGDYGMAKVLQIILMVLGVHAVEAYLLNPQIYASKLKLHPVVVICVLYMAEHLVGVQGLIIAVPCAVYVINNLILGNVDDSVPPEGKEMPCARDRNF